MDEFLLYFLGGMFGAELIKKIATRPYGFLVLWLMSFILVSVFFIIMFSSVIIVGIFTDPAAEQSLMQYLLDSVALLYLKIILPWGILFCLGVSFLFALSYYGHYRIHLQEALEDKKKNNKPGRPD